jgi:hypothetical protein
MIRKLPWWLLQLAAWTALITALRIDGLPGIALALVGIALGWAGWYVAARGDRPQDLRASSTRSRTSWPRRRSVS